MERLTAQALKSKEKKKLIYDISMKMFSEYGYDQTTIRDICKSAQITNSTFYNFFGDKMGVLVQFYYEVLSWGNAYLEPTQDNLSHPFQAICDFFIKTTQHLDSVNHDVARACILNIPAFIKGNYDTLNWNNEILRIATFLDAGKKHGSVDVSLNSYETAEYLLATANGISVYWLTLTDKEDYLEVAGRLMPKIFLSLTDEEIRVS